MIAWDQKEAVTARSAPPKHATTRLQASNRSMATSMPHARAPNTALMLLPMMAGSNGKWNRGTHINVNSG